MEKIELDKQSQQLINGLSIVKEKFIENSEQLKVSVRKDIVIAELQDILDSNADIFSLREAIKETINKYKREIKNTMEEDNKDDE